MDVSGIIFASVDCDADAIEDWNRWYDLEHLPPNIALPGIMTGKRYVAPPELHDVREPAKRLDGFADGRGVHVTVYTLAGDPAQVLADMTSYRDSSRTPIGCSRRRRRSCAPATRCGGRGALPIPC